MTTGRDNGTEPAPTDPIKPDYSRKNVESQKWHPIRSPAGSERFVLGVKQHAFQKCCRKHNRLLQANCIVVKQKDVVHVAHIPRDADRFLHEMIKRTKIQVGKVLAGQVSDRHPLAGKGSRRTLVDEQVRQPQNTWILHKAPDDRFQDPVIGGLEVMPDIQLGKSFEAPDEYPCPLDCGHRARSIAATVPLPTRQA